MIWVKSNDWKEVNALIERVHHQMVLIWTCNGIQLSASAVQVLRRFTAASAMMAVQAHSCQQGRRLMAAWLPTAASAIQCCHCQCYAAFANSQLPLLCCLCRLTAASATLPLQIHCCRFYAAFANSLHIHCCQCYAGAKARAPSASDLSANTFLASERQLATEAVISVQQLVQL
eukprot:1161827-Pelagomonas_calceolata.AAC.12